MGVIDYDDLVSRNYFFLSKEIQKKLSKVKLVFFGCGLASVTAEMAVRIGVRHFVLIDHDKVEISNLNRQAYDSSSISNYKVDVLLKKLKAINSDIDVSKIVMNISNISQVIEFIKEGDIIINTLDCDSLYFEVVNACMQQNKLVVCPFNPGFAGLVVCFNKASGTLFDLLGTEKVESGLEFSKKLIKNNNQIELPNYIRENIDEFFQEIERRGYEPQITIGVHMSSSIVLSCIIKYLNGDTIPLSPRIIFRSLYDL